MALTNFKGVTETPGVTMRPGVDAGPGVGGTAPLPANPIYADFTAGWPGAPWAFERASSALHFNSAGVLISVAANVPRIDFDPVTLAARGVMREAASTNSVRNPRAEGAVPGTPGTPPTNWFIGTSGGVASSIVATGSEDGIPYLDVRFQGTTAATVNCTARADTTTGIAAVQGQVWTLSIYARLIAGSFGSPAQGPYLSINEYNSVGTSVATLTGQKFNPLPTGAALRGQRYSFTATLSNATTASITCIILTQYLTGVAVDFTLRIGGWQVERNPAMTSLILPPVAAPAATTRASEGIYANLPSSYQGRDAISIGVNATVPYISGAPQIGAPISAANATSGATQYLRVEMVAGGDVRSAATVSSSSVISASVPNSTPGSIRVATSLSPGGQRWALNGVVQTATIGLPLTNLTVVGVMNRIDTQTYISGWVRAAEILGYVASDGVLAQMPAPGH